MASGEIYQSKLPIIVVFTALLVSNLQLSVVIPVLPDLIVSNNLSHHHVPLIVGTVIGTGYLSELLFIPVAIFLLSWIGHSWTLTVCALAETLGCFIIAGIKGLPALYIGRIFQCSGAIMLDISASCLVANFYRKSSRSRAFASVFHALPVSYVTSFLFGTLVYEELGYQSLLIGVGILTAVVIPMFFWLPEDSEDLEPLQPVQKEKLEYRGTLLVLCLMSNFLVWAAYLLMDSTQPYDFQARFGAEVWQVGVIMAVSVVAQIVAQIVVGEFSAVLWWMWTLMIMVSGAGLLIYPWIPGLWYSIITQCMVRMGHGTVNTATGCIIAEWVDAGTEPDLLHTGYSKLYGLHSLSKVTGLASGALIGGILLDFIGVRGLYWGAGGVITGLGLIFSILCYLIRKNSS